MRTPPPRPFAIVYPKKIRKQFHKHHPFQLARFKVLVENELVINRTDFSEFMLEDMHTSQIDGEA